MTSEKRKNEGAEDRNIYVLSIGINKYKSPEIRNLGGCVDDVNKLKKFLQAKFSISDAHYKTITDEEATRQGIIRTFRNHFSHLKDGDIALLHYSGHGSWEITSEEFAKAGLEPPGGRNELIVCQDSDDPGVFNIADKELRMLISEVQFPRNEKPKNIHFVCLFDCCHSGSLIREDDEKINVRMISRRKEPRPLDAYLEGQYSLMKGITLPSVNYISLTACAPRESAIEDRNGGLFTNALIRVLNTTLRGGYIPSYSELHAIVREITKKNARNKQTPHFEYAGNINPFDSFLLQGETKRNHYPELIFKDGEWQIERGAIHGIDFDSVKKLAIPIFKHSEPEKIIAYAKVNNVGLEYTALQLNEIDAVKLNTENTYLIALTGTPLPLKITTEATGLLVRNKLMKEFLNEKNNYKFLLTEIANYELRISENQLCIFNQNIDVPQLIYGIRQVDESAIQHIIEQLSKISRWEQVNSVYTPLRTSIDPDQLDLKFQYEDYNGVLHTHSFDTAENEDSKTFQITLSYDKEQGGIPYSFKVMNNTDHKLFYYLIHLKSHYAISQKYEAYLKEVYSKEIIELYDSTSNNTGLGIADNYQNEIQVTFLLITSRTKLNIPYVFEQTGFGACFGQIVDSLEEWEERSPRGIKRDVALKNRSNVNWAVKRVEIKITSQSSVSAYQKRPD